MAATPGIEELLPHRGSALLIDEVLSYQPDAIVAGATAQDLPAWMGLELMAQAAAACAGMEARQSGAAARRGMLVGCRSYRASFPSFSGFLKVAASRTASDQNGFSVFDCSIANAAGETLATGNIQVLIQ